MTETYTPSTEDVRNYFSYGCGPKHTWVESRADFDRWYAQETGRIRSITLKEAEEEAAQALNTWWLTDTLPEDDTDSVMQVRKAIRSLINRNGQETP